MTKQSYSSISVFEILFFIDLQISPRLDSPSQILFRFCFHSSFHSLFHDVWHFCLFLLFIMLFTFASVSKQIFKNRNDKVQNVFYSLFLKFFFFIDFQISARLDSPSKNLFGFIFCFHSSSFHSSSFHRFQISDELSSLVEILFDFVL